MFGDKGGVSDFSLHTALYFLNVEPSQYINFQNKTCNTENVKELWFPWSSQQTRPDKVAARIGQYLQEMLDGGFRDKGLVNDLRGFGVPEVKVVDKATHGAHRCREGGRRASQNRRLFKINRYLTL